MCGYLLSGKYQGLTENEILGLLVFDQEHWQHFIEHCHEDHRKEVQEINRLPIVIWSRLFLDLEPYLTEREADGLSIISFYHRKFVDCIATRYAATHPLLADYFEQEPLYQDENEERPNVRKVVEQPYQQTLAGQWMDVVDKSLANFSFLMAKTRAHMVEGMLEDYRFAFDRASQETRQALVLWDAFFRERAHILRRGNEEWPAYKILLQLAVEHADDSPVTAGAERWLDEGKCTWPWLRRIQRVAHAGKNPCLAVLEGHTSYIGGAIETKDGHFLSWSGDHTLRLWDRQGKSVAIFEGHTKGIRGALETKDGHFLSWSDDHTLRLWDREGKPLAGLEGHTGWLDGAIETKDGHFLSWSGDNTLRLWDRDGNPLTIFEGHTEGIWGALETQNGRLLSWSRDNTLRLWDLKGQALGVYSIEDGLRRFPEFRIAYGGKKNNFSQSLFRAIGNRGWLTVFNKVWVSNLFWHGDSECTARHLKSDGLAVLTQANGQVCFLRLYYGNRPISVKELEELYNASEEGQL